MIVDFTCSRCGVDHALPPEQCPFDGRPPRRVERGPAVEEVFAEQQQALQEKVDAEKQRERDRLDRLKNLERAKVQDMCAKVRQLQKAALAERLDQGRAVSADAHESRRQEAQQKRFGLRMAARVEEQQKPHAEDRARSEALGERLAARARRMKRMKERRGQ